MEFEIVAEEFEAASAILVDGIRAHLTENMGAESGIPLAVLASIDGQVIGGIAGRTIYRNFLIDTVWVHKAQRGSGLGRELMMKAQAMAIDRGCLQAQLDTLSVQAPGFYRKLGFEVVGEVPEFPGSPARYFMLKRYNCRVC